MAHLSDLLERDLWLLLEQQRGRDHGVVGHRLLLKVELVEVPRHLEGEVVEVQIFIIVQVGLGIDWIAVLDEHLAKLASWHLVDVLEQIEQVDVLELAAHHFCGEEGGVEDSLVVYRDWDYLNIIFLQLLALARSEQPLNRIVRGQRLRDLARPQPGVILVNIRDLILLDDLLQQGLVHIVNALVVLLLPLEQDDSALFVKLHEHADFKVILLVGEEVTDLDVSEEVDVLQNAHVDHRPVQGHEHDASVRVVGCHPLNTVQPFHINIERLNELGRELMREIKQRVQSTLVDVPSQPVQLQFNFIFVVPEIACLHDLELVIGLQLLVPVLLLLIQNLLDELGEPGLVDDLPCLDEVVRDYILLDLERSKDVVKEVFVSHQDLLHVMVARDLILLGGVDLQAAIEFLEVARPVDPPDIAVEFIPFFWRHHIEERVNPLIDELPVTRLEEFKVLVCPEEALLDLSVLLNILVEFL